MSVLALAGAATHELEGTRFTSLATPRRGTSETAVWQVEIAPGTPSTPHSLTREEVFVVLAGTARVRVGDAPAGLAGLGDAIVVPAGWSSSWPTPRRAAPAAVLPARRWSGRGRRHDLHAAVGRVSEPEDPPTRRPGSRRRGSRCARLLAMGFRLAITGLHERLADGGWATCARPTASSCSRCAPGR